MLRCQVPPTSGQRSYNVTVTSRSKRFARRCLERATAEAIPDIPDPIIAIETDYAEGKGTQQTSTIAASCTPVPTTTPHNSNQCVHTIIHRVHFIAGGRKGRAHKPCLGKPGRACQATLNTALTGTPSCDNVLESSPISGRPFIYNTEGTSGEFSPRAIASFICRTEKQGDEQLDSAAARTPHPTILRVKHASCFSVKDTSILVGSAAGNGGAVAPEGGEDDCDA